MNIAPTTAAPSESPAEAIAVGLFADGPLPAAAQEIDRATGGQITRLRDGQELYGKACELTPLWAPPGVKPRLVLLVGLGERAKLQPGGLFRAAAAASRQLAAKARGTVALYLAEGSDPELHEAGLTGALVGCRGQDLYRADRKRTAPESLWWQGATEGVLRSARILGESINLTRRLVNEPPQEIFPASFCAEVARVGQECNLDVEIWDEKRLEQERCGSLLAVAKGSSKPARLAIIRYQGGPASQKPLALVGKGVTFDSGGLSLKPTDSMLTMKCDMAGAATVLGAVRAISLLQLPQNVIGLMGLVENMTGPAAMKLGDVLKARSGKTIEVHNTDAEGRLVLADVLDVAVERGAERIIDLATLTGACVVALGNDVAGLMSNNQPWADRVLASSQQTGEPLWQLPMFPEYAEHIKSEVADIKNVGDGRWGGAISAAKFLEEFVGTVPWVHLDIAGPAFFDKPRNWLDAGASGLFVRTLVDVARKSG